MKAVGRVVRIAAVKYFWPEWYVREDEDTGRVVHSGPWLTKWAAEALVSIMTSRRRYEGRMD